jgi:hypothetical protein
VDPIQELIELEAIKKVRRLYWDADAMTAPSRSVWIEHRFERHP